jgi:hypothetical protein
MLINNYFYINPEIENFEEYSYGKDATDILFFSAKKFEFTSFYYSINKPFPENHFLKNFRFKKTKVNDDFKHFVTIMNRKGLLGKFRQYFINVI